MSWRIFWILNFDIRKNPALQDSPPAAGRFSDKFPFRRSAICPEGFLFHRGFHRNFLWNKNKIESRIRNDQIHFRILLSIFIISVYTVLLFLMQAITWLLQNKKNFNHLKSFFMPQTGIEPFYLISNTDRKGLWRLHHGCGVQKVFKRLLHTNWNLSGQSPSILLRKTVLSLKSPTGAFIVLLRSTNTNL